MRAIFGIVSLLLVVAVVGMLAKRQLSALAPTTAAGTTSTGVTSGAAAGAAPAPRQQVQQFQQSLQGTLDQAQQARPMPDDSK